MVTNFNYHSVLRMMGVLFLVLGMAFIPTIAVALIYREYFEASCFAATMVPCFIVGFVLMRIYSPSGLRTKQRDVYLIVSLCWIVSSIVGSIPLVLTGALPNPIDAFFEICSGFSTTGATVLNDIEAQARSVLFWRSFTHWLGGMGIIVFAAALLPSMGIGGQLVASAEAPGPTLSKTKAKFSDTAKDLYKLYLIFTAIEIILLMFGGMTLYDAAIHTFGTVGTGGFSNYSASIGHFQSPYIEWVIIVFMVLCGINFNLYFLLPKKRIKEFFFDEELRVYLGLIFVITALSSAMLFAKGFFANIGDTIRTVAFHVVSVITTTGYVTADYDLWPTFCKLAIMIVMITGACQSSTGGGVKIIRVLTTAKFVKRGFFLKLHPNRVSNLAINKRKVEQNIVTDIVYFVFLYVATLFVGAILISFDGKDMVTNFSAAMTCLSNVGPGFAEVGPTFNFSGYSNFSTFILSILMIAGRLELFTFVMLFSPHFWNSDRA
ncbi:MAG: TrkH family potassium uptake protein [Firmicutes bacterium]|nr:TrkH family potassium uptake protein [Bacillota bacterium]